MGTIPNDRQIHTRLSIGRTDGVTWADLTDCLARAHIELGDVSGLGADGTGGDMPVRRMTIVLRNDGAPLSPHIQASSWNQFGGGYSPLLWPMREVMLDVATTAPGSTPSTGDWVRLFHGYLGDSIQVDGDSVTCECRDLARRLQNTYIETVRTYGSESGVAAETVIQSILNDNVGSGVVALYTPMSPGFMLHPYRVEYQSVWDAIQQIAAQIGWWLGYRWDVGSAEFRLTLLAPPRGKDAGSADWTLTAEDDIYTQPLDISDADIRNVVAVTYTDRTLGKRQAVTVSDPTSIAEYGRRAMGIEEQDASLIDTSAEAQALAQAAVDDLRDMTGTTRITMPLMPRLELFHGVIVQNPLVSDQDDFYGVDSVMHDLDFEAGRFRTEVIASRRVVGARTRWLKMQTRPGGTVPITGGDVIGGQATATLVVAASDSSWRGRQSADYICDGVSDQVQINDALDWLVSDGRTGGKVMLLEGTYVIDDHILMPSNTQIEGQGPSTVIKIKDGYTLPGYGSKLYMIANKDGSSGNSRLRVAHLTLDGNKAHTSETAYIWTILWWYASDSAVEDVQSVNSPAHDIEVYGSRNRVVGCRMRDARTGGLRVIDGSSCTVTDNVIENCGTHGISVSKLSGSVCNNNVSTGNEFGISVYECASCTVSGNAISLSGYDGIYMYKCVECQVTGNNITSSGQKTNPDWGNSGIRVFRESSRNNIQHNTIRRGSLSMKPAYGIWIQSADCDRNLVTNNDLYLSGTTTSLKNDGSNTVVTAGNRA
jgi:parallel beta-helix repeat protein